LRSRRSSAIIGNGGTDAPLPTAILRSICDLDPRPFR
jgi:hypothetical protein